jgi:SAM-dependent methyltransferase
MKFYRLDPKVDSAKYLHSVLVNALDKRAYFLRKLYEETSVGVDVKDCYLDVGAGTTINGVILGEGFKRKLFLDISAIGMDGVKGELIIGDAQDLPLADNSVDLLSLISLIEHTPNPQKVLSEAIRVVRIGGEIVIQLPNLYFPLDLHIGMPNPFWVPKFFRNKYVKLLGYPDFFNEVYSLPTSKEIINWSGKRVQLIGICRIVYPSSFIPIMARPFYWLLEKCNILSLLPLGHLYVFRKVM